MTGKFNWSIARLLVLAAAFLFSQAALADWNSAPETLSNHPAWIFTPSSTLPNGKHGLMIVLHGCDQTNDELKQFGNLEPAADANGLVVAVPSVGDNPWGPGCWDYNGGTDGSGHAAEIIELTQTLLQRKTLNIDPSQVYIVGLSSGGAMSLLVACEAPDVFAGVGSVAGPSVGSAQANATGSVPNDNAGDAIATCKALAGDKSSSFATQVANIAYGDMDKNGPDADFPFSAGDDDPGHPGQYAVVSIDWSQDNVRILRAIYGAGTLGPDTAIEGNLGAERDASANGQMRLGELVIFDVGHAWPAGTGQPNNVDSGGKWMAQSGLNYPQYIAAWFVRHNLRTGSPPVAEGIPLPPAKPREDRHRPSE